MWPCGVAARRWVVTRLELRTRHTERLSRGCKIGEKPEEVCQEGETQKEKRIGKKTPATTKPEGEKKKAVTNGGRGAHTSDFW